MIDNCTPIIGVINEGEDKLNFYLNDFTVTLMQTEPSDIKLYGSFMYGSIFSRALFNQIAIYKGERTISFIPPYRMNIDSYILGTDQTNWETFDYIDCVGGTLRNLFVRFESNIDQYKDRFSNPEHSIEHKFSIGSSNCSLVIHFVNKVNIDPRFSKFANDAICLRLKFDSPQPLNLAFAYIQKLKHMLSFMTFRKNVSFDEISLGQNQHDTPKMKVFLKEDTPYPEKDYLRNISFHDLGHSIGKLASIIFNNEENKPFYESGFLPESNDILWMSDSKIRLICSSLEYELNNEQSSSLEQGEDLKELIKQVKSVIKAHKASSHKLSEKTYSSIYSSLQYWSKPAGERFCDLYHDHINEMQALIQVLFDQATTISDEDISELVKYRNSITHGSQNAKTNQIDKTALMLQGLVYCCILKRIGVDEDTIIRLCREGKILS